MEERLSETNFTKSLIGAKSDILFSLKFRLVKFSKYCNPSILEISVGSLPVSPLKSSWLIAKRAALSTDSLPVAAAFPVIITANFLARLSSGNKELNVLPAGTTAFKLVCFN
ncbi:internalin-I [Listeria monocytogenes]|nr:internalin-I [Listeria monocytogenes]